MDVKKENAARVAVQRATYEAAVLEYDNAVDEYQREISDLAAHDRELANALLARDAQAKKVISARELVEALKIVVDKTLVRRFDVDILVANPLAEPGNDKPAKVVPGYDDAKYAV